MGRAIGDAVMNIQMVRMTSNPVPIANTDKAPCVAAILRDDYRQCTNKAVRIRGTWQLCVPHCRQDELEIVVDTDA